MFESFYYEFKFNYLCTFVYIKHESLTILCYYIICVYVKIERKVIKKIGEKVNEMISGKCKYIENKYFFGFIIYGPNYGINNFNLYKT